LKAFLRCCTAGVCLWLGSGQTLHAADHNATQRPHAYAFDQPELVSAQRVFGVANATLMLGAACDAYPEATTAFQAWLVQNQLTMQTLTTTLAAHYRIAQDAPDLRQRVVQAMHLKTALDLSPAALAEACPTLPDTLALPHMNLQQRYRDTLAEVRDPDYLKPRYKPNHQIAPLKTDSMTEQAP